MSLETKMMKSQKVAVSPARCAAADTMISLLQQSSCEPPSLSGFSKIRGVVLQATPSPRPVVARTSSMSSTTSTGSQSSRGSYRKDKSLGSLCQKFLLLYSTLKQHYISLDIAAHNLKIERRRIYDVVNVLESVSVVMRRAKNCYRWRGFNNVSERLDEIRNKENVTVTNKNLQVSPIVTSSKSCTGEKKTQGTSSTPTASNNKSEERNKTTKGGRRAKSLGRLSRRFIALFLNYKPVLSLEEAATQILHMDNVVMVPQNLRTKVRRLYDIANVSVESL
jgi:transcription factor E2F7/8